MTAPPVDPLAGKSKNPGPRSEDRDHRGRSVVRTCLSASGGSRWNERNGDRRMIRLAIGWLTMFVIGTDLFVVSPLLPLIAVDYQISPAAAGLSVTVFSEIHRNTACAPAGESSPAMTQGVGRTATTAVSAMSI